MATYREKMCAVCKEFFTVTQSGGIGKVRGTSAKTCSEKCRKILAKSKAKLRQRGLKY